MEPKNSSSATEEALLAKAKKKKSAAITNAVFIGFLIGIIIYSVAKNAWGLSIIIPLFLIYQLVKKPKGDKTSEQEPNERDLK